jgi:hypothetical protein
MAACIAVCIIIGSVLTPIIGRSLERRRSVDGYAGLQAVFLTDGQVYFGAIRHMDDRTVRLADIYYIQKSPQGDEASQTDVSLAKLGNELHGPEDWMDINRDHVMFIEQLKEEGRVAKAIKEYRAQGK